MVLGVQSLAREVARKLSCVRWHRVLCTTRVHTHKHELTAYGMPRTRSKSCAKEGQLCRHHTSESKKHLEENLGNISVALGQAVLS